MNLSPKKENIVLDHVHNSDGIKQEQPKTPRSAFMCFTDAKKKELYEKDSSQSKGNILKLVAKQWRELSASERAYWDEESRNDKVRFVREKAEYKGDWVVPKRRAKKHPLAPKRPMSAFLKFSQTRRPQVKRENPDMSNTDVSRLLGEMWRNAGQTEKKPYIEREMLERAAYKATIKKWREDQAHIDAASRSSQQSLPQNTERVEECLQNCDRVPSEVCRPVLQDNRSFEPLRFHCFEDALSTVEGRTHIDESFYDTESPSKNRSLYRHQGSSPAVYREREGGRYSAFYSPQHPLPPFQMHSPHHGVCGHPEPLSQQYAPRPSPPRSDLSVHHSPAYFTDKQPHKQRNQLTNYHYC